ncbi:MULTISPECIES: hypothetical protein [unclassified Variovorax]|uniref:hypothetical protein n=1 Tax=unclassified Variovorax TaxID=663243 RepID=UPI002577D0BA|nr:MULTISPECIES: hypothetical protein [unclassified Variovorax]MDM0086768.1 hypothetical protein [Variovorax sp. J22G40]MDM0144976.1 hypothetical protein [Variovorax sp. J2P1-31]
MHEFPKGEIIDLVNTTEADMPSLSPAAQPALERAQAAPEAHPLSASTVEIWIRTKGTRRQAFYRQGTTCPWQAMQVTHADRALRAGTISIGSAKDAPVVVVPRETSSLPDHPAAREFAATAREINRAIDALALDAALSV